MKICSIGVLQQNMGRRVRDRIIVEVTTIYAITTKIVRSVHVHSEVYSIQHYVIKSVSDLRQIGGFLRVLRFSPRIKLTATIY